MLFCCFTNPSLINSDFGTVLAVPSVIPIAKRHDEEVAAPAVVPIAKRSGTKDGSAIRSPADAGRRMVPGVGLGPTRPCGQQILSLPRIPVPPPRPNLI